MVGIIPLNLRSQETNKGVPHARARRRRRRSGRARAWRCEADGQAGGERACRRFETGGSLSRRVSVPRAPAQMGRARGRARRGESEVAGDGRERGRNPAAFVFVPRPGRVRLQ
jgi:hypothetical protein